MTRASKDRLLGKRCTHSAKWRDGSGENCLRCMVEISKDSALSENRSRAELLAIHEAVMNPTEIVERADDTFTLSMVKQFVLRALAAQQPDTVCAKDQLRAVLEGLECERIGILMTQGAPTLRAVAAEIARAAKLGANLYAAAPKDAQPSAEDMELVQLMRFYSVSTVRELVDIQARHIVRLQEKLPPLRDTQPRNPRKG